MAEKVKVYDIPESKIEDEDDKEEAQENCVCKVTKIKFKKLK